MARKGNAYEKMKSKGKGSKLNFKSALKQEETYWLGAAVPAILFAGLIDGGVTMAIAFGAKKLYEHNNKK